MIFKIKNKDYYLFQLFHLLAITLIFVEIIIWFLNYFWRTVIWEKPYNSDTYWVWEALEPPTLPVSKLIFLYLFIIVITGLVIIIKDLNVNKKNLKKIIKSTTFIL